MKKNVIVLIAALCVLAGVIYISKSQKKQAGMGQYAAGNVNISSIEAFRIASGSDTVLVRNKDGLWVIGDNDWPADTARTSKFFEVISKLQDKEVASKNPERTKEYGMDSSSVREVALWGSGGGEKFKAYIGKTSSIDYNSSYWGRQLGGTVYRTPGNLSTNVDTKADQWFDKEIFSFDKNEIMAMRVLWRDSTGKINDFTVNSIGNDQWSMIAPKSGMAKQNQIDPMVGRFKNLTLSEFLEKDEAPKMGDSPDIEIEITLKDGSRHKLSAQKADDDSYYVTHPVRETIVKMQEWRLSVFKKTADEIYEEPPAADTTAEAPVELEEE